MKNTEIGAKTGAGISPDALIKEIEKVKWHKMINDIEKYQKIRELIISTFRVVLYVSPNECKDFIEDQIPKLEKRQEYIFDFEEMNDFLIFSDVLATVLLNSLEDERAEEFDVPYLLVERIQKLVSVNKNREYSGDDLDDFLSAVDVKLKNLLHELEEANHNP